MTDVIASPRNPLFRLVKGLDAEAECRRREGLFLLWGARFVEEAMQDRSRVARLIVGESLSRQTSVRPLLRLSQQLDIPVSVFADRLLEDLAPGASDQGLLTLARARREPLGPLLGRSHCRVLLIADRIQDPGNLGVLVRLAEASQVTAVVPLRGTVDPFNTRAARASAGSILRVAIADPPSKGDWDGILREHHLRVVVSLARDGVPLQQADLTGPLALVVGNEGEGVGARWVDSADLRVTIHLGGKVESLNVSSAAAILLYEAFRQRAAVRSSG